jgi:membrane-associated PAP2 superfamily phosphatase
VAVVGLILLLAWDASGADMPLSRMFGNGDGFALRHHWLVQHVLHDALAQGLHLVFVLLGVNVLFPLPVIGAMPRAQRLGWWLMSLLCALVISLLKHQSRVSCPWNFAEFGGSAHELAHLSLAAWRGRGDGGPGHCFPAGHVSNAFALVGGTFALRAVSMRASRLWLASVCVIGFVLGVTQLLRGAHFPSHSLWTAWICWTLSALLWHSGQTMPRFARLGAR